MADIPDFIKNMRGDSEDRRYFDEEGFFGTALSDVYCAAELLEGVKDNLKVIEEVSMKMVKCDITGNPSEALEQLADCLEEMNDSVDSTVSQAFRAIEHMKSILLIMHQILEALAYLNRPD